MPRPKRARVTPSVPVNIASRRAAAAENAIPSDLLEESRPRRALANVSNIVHPGKANSIPSENALAPVKITSKRNQKRGGRERDESVEVVGDLSERTRRRTRRSKEIFEHGASEDQRGNTSSVAQPRTRGKAAPKIDGHGVRENNVKSSNEKRNKRTLNTSPSASEQDGASVVSPPLTEAELLPEAQTMSGSTPKSTRQVNSSPKKLHEIVLQMPASVHRLRNTPGGDRSLLALGNWKQRARQPSIVRTARRESSDNGSEDSFDLPASDDFDPDDESTPLKVAEVQEQATSFGSDGKPITDSARASTSSARKRKRSPQSAQNNTAHELSVLSSPLSSVRSSESMPSDPAEILSRQAARKSGQLNESDAIHTAPEHGQGPEIESELQDSPRSSSTSLQSPETTQSPIRVSEPQRNTSTRSTDRKKLDKKSKRLTTAELTSLLPQWRPRRAKAANADFQVLSSSEREDSSREDEPEEDEDELAPRQRKARKRRTSHTGKRPTQTPVRTRKKNTSKKGASSAAPSRANAPKRTYGRNSSDKENHDEEEEPSEFMQHLAGNEDDGDGTVVGREGRDREGKGKGRKGNYRESIELSAAAKKFAEVDDWEMEFESVETGGRSSSPWR